MEIMEMLEQFVMPLVLVGCFVIGAALKSTEKYPNKYIPLTVLILGGILAPLATGSWTAEQIIIGCISGWASTGLDQTVKQLTKGE